MKPERFWILLPAEIGTKASEQEGLAGAREGRPGRWATSAQLAGGDWPWALVDWVGARVWEGGPAPGSARCSRRRRRCRSPRGW